ncbi:MAG: hypothetical protein R3Y40_09015 [Eubacteriales bacterium]
MIYITMPMYIAAAIIGGFAVNLFFKGRVNGKFGNLESAKVIHVEKVGKGLKRQFNAEVTYKVAKKKYRTTVTGEFYKKIERNADVAIRYNVLKPSDAILDMKDDFRPILILSLSIFVCANLLSML